MRKVETRAGARGDARRWRQCAWAVHRAWRGSGALRHVCKVGLFSSHAATSPRVTASHPNSEVKLGRVWVVLPSGTGWEGQMLHVLFVPPPLPAPRFRLRLVSLGRPPWRPALRGQTLHVSPTATDSPRRPAWRPSLRPDAARVVASREPHRAAWCAARRPDAQVLSPLGRARPPVRRAAARCRMFCRGRLQSLVRPASGRPPALLPPAPSQMPHVICCAS